MSSLSRLLGPLLSRSGFFLSTDTQLDRDAFVLHHRFERKPALRGRRGSEEMVQLFYRWQGHSNAVELPDGCASAAAAAVGFKRRWRSLFSLLLLES